MLDNSSGQATQISPLDADILRQTARWARFLAIVGFVMIGVVVAFGVIMDSFTSEMMERESEYGGSPFNLDIFGSILTSWILIGGAIYFVPTLLLYQFATRTLKALGPTFDPLTFSSGLQAHRRLYKFMGILMIIMLCLYGVGFLILLMVGGMATRF